jgi:hypothetical protein
MPSIFAVADAIQSTLAPAPEPPQRLLEPTETTARCDRGGVEPV